MPSMTSALGALKTGLASSASQPIHTPGGGGGDSGSKETGSTPNKLLDTLSKTSGTGNIANGLKNIFKKKPATGGADGDYSATDGYSYKKGGSVKKTGMAKVHKGEYVLTKSQVKKFGKKGR